jgi:LysM domain
MVAPLEENGSNFPCKGYLSDLSTPAGKSTVSYAAGQQATFKTAGVAAAHNGGSCQVSLSYDNGKTWKVIKSFIGNCVRSAGGNVFDQNQTYSFTIPADAKAGDAVWAWTWFNQTGNREMYMNCAHVTITGSGTSTLDDHPDMFVANVNNGCTTKEGNDLEFPNPGKDVERTPANNAAPTGPPVGNCPAGSGAPAPAPAPGPGSAPPPPPKGAAPAPAPGGRSHTVATGEFCASIAQSNGLTVAALLAANPAVNSGCTNLQVGQVLNLRRRSRVMRAIA